MVCLVQLGGGCGNNYKIRLLLFTNLIKNLWDCKTKAQDPTSGAICMFSSFFGEIWEQFKDGKEIFFFLPFLEEHDQLQTNGISKRFDAQRRDYTQIVDFSMKIEMLINFVWLSKWEI